MAIRGVICAGGKGLRLMPYTADKNKHMVEVGGKPMIQHAIEKLVEAGIKDIIIVTGEEHAGGLLNFVGSGRKFGCDITVKIQDTANGIVGAIALTRNLMRKGQRFVVVLGDNIFSDKLNKYIPKMWSAGSAKVLLHETDRPNSFGIADVDDEGMVVGIEEKPTNPKSNFAVTGIYQFDTKFFEYADTVVPSKRGELEITDVLNQYIHDGALYAQDLDGLWSDCGSVETYHKVNDMLNKVNN